MMHTPSIHHAHSKNASCTICAGSQTPYILNFWYLGNLHAKVMHFLWLLLPMNTTITICLCSQTPCMLHFCLFLWKCPLLRPYRVIMNWIWRIKQCTHFSCLEYAQDIYWTCTWHAHSMYWLYLDFVHYQEFINAACLEVMCGVRCTCLGSI